MMRTNSLIALRTLNNNKKTTKNLQVSKKTSTTERFTITDKSGKEVVLVNPHKIF